jgi:thiol-disulfide isomerase/thioredoxin
LVARTAVALLTLFLAAAGGPLEVENAAGERVALALGEGERALVVHFWASWCPDCAGELPGLERAVRDCAGSVRVLAVNVAEPADVARRFLERHNSALPLYRDPDGRVWRRLARGLPANLIWTRASRHTEVGPKSPSEWQGIMQSLGCPSMKNP